MTLLRKVTKLKSFEFGFTFIFLSSKLNIDIYLYIFYRNMYYFLNI